MILKINILYKSIYFKEYAEAVCRAINNFGFISKIIDERDLYQEIDDVDGLIYVGIHEFEDVVRKRNVVTCGIQTEQITTRNSGCINFGQGKLVRLLKILKNFDFVFEWSRDAAYLANIDNYIHLPHSHLEQFDLELNTIKKYDLIFIGDQSGIKNRRYNIIKKLRSNYSFSPNINDIWGEAKYKAMAESKIVLNLHFENSFVFESPRFYDAIGNKNFLLSEKVYDSYPFIENIDYGYFYLHNLEKQIDFYLFNENKRAEIIQNGFQKCMLNNIQNSIGIVLDKIILEKYNLKYGSYKLHKYFKKFGFNLLKIL